MRVGRGWLLATAAGCAGFVGLVCSVTRSATLAAVDAAISSAVVERRTPGLTTFFQALTALGTLPAVVGAGLTGVLILVRRTRSWVPPTVLAATVALSSLTVALLKVGVARPRPGTSERIGPAALDLSFPSGHTGNGTVALCLATTLVCLTLPRSAARSAAFAGALLLSAGIGASRVYLGYHWPSDVVGGWLLAGTFTCAAVSVVLALGARGSPVRVVPSTAPGRSPARGR